MDLKLYEITAAMDDVLRKLELGEISEAEANAALDKLDLAADKKMQSICAAIKNLGAEEIVYRDEARRMENHARRLAKNREWLKGYLGAAIGEGNKMSIGTHKISWRSFPKVEIDLNYKFPDEFYVIEKKLSKELIEEKLDAGMQVPGAKMIPNIKMILT